MIHIVSKPKNNYRFCCMPKNDNFSRFDCGMYVFKMSDCQHLNIDITWTTSRRTHRHIYIFGELCDSCENVIRGRVICPLRGRLASRWETVCGLTFKDKSQIDIYVVTKDIFDNLGEYCADFRKTFANSEELNRDKTIEDKLKYPY